MAEHRGESLPVSKLRGLSPEERRALRKAGYTRCDDLANLEHNPDSLRALAEEAGFTYERAIALARRADMAAIKGVGAMFGLMLEDIGVDSVKLLAEQDAERLAERLRRFNADARLVRRSPTNDEVKSWITQAQIAHERSKSG